MPHLPHPTMKHCRKCDKTKDITEFYFDITRNAHIAPCKECRIATVSSLGHSWRKKNVERNREMANKARLKSKYGITHEQLLHLWESQDKACAICHRPISLNSTTKLSKPHIDHCHVTGVVRGLLCLTCNTGLGMLGDSLDLLDSARAYLLRSLGTTESTKPSDSASVSAAPLQYHSMVH